MKSETTQKINGTQESFEKILRKSLYKRMKEYLNLQKGLTGNDKVMILEYLNTHKTKDYDWGTIYNHPISQITQHLVDGKLKELEKDTSNTFKRKLTYQEIEDMNL